MADFPRLNGWQGWLKYGYTDLDPFKRPVPAPIAGIFDDSNGDLRTLQFNPAWSPLITGALSRLEFPELYLSDGENTVQDVRKLINYVAGIETLELPAPSETTCTYYPSYYAGIEYIPHNPFDGNSTFDPLYPVAPFFRFGAIDTILPNWLEDFFLSTLEWATGYRENDIFVSYLSLPTLTNPFDGLDYPTIKLTVQGSGKVSLHLLSVPFGGRALVSLDPPDIGDLFNAIWSENDRLLELNRDIVSVPPETDLDNIEEVIFSEDGTHEIYITFLPVINDETPFFQMGGGFRGYELCGNLTVIDPVSGQPIDFTDSENSYQEGMIIMSTDDMRNAVKRGILDVFSLAVGANGDGTVSNLQSPISIGTDSDGNLAIGVDRNGAIDVTASTDLQESQKYGGCHEIAIGISTLLGEIILQRTTNGRTADRVSELMRYIYVLVPVADTIDAFRDAIDGTLYANATNEITPVLNTLSLERHLYCYGATKRQTQIWINEFENGNSQDSADIADWWRAVVDSISAEQFALWYSEGLAKPNQGYLTSGCFSLPFEFTFTAPEIEASAYRPFDTFPNFGSVKYSAQIEGVIKNADNEEFNGIYLRVPNSDYLYRPLEVRYNGSNRKAPNSQPPNGEGKLTGLTYSIGGSGTKGGANGMIGISTEFEAWRAKTPLSGELNITFEVV